MTQELIQTEWVVRVVQVNLAPLRLILGLLLLLLTSPQGLVLLSELECRLLLLLTEKSRACCLRGRGVQGQSPENVLGFNKYTY